MASRPTSRPRCSPRYKASRPGGPYGAGVRDLRKLPWCSIDNDDSRDLDQLTVARHSPEAQAAGGGGGRGVAGHAGSALDRHAAVNTTSVYTAVGELPHAPGKTLAPT